MISSDDFNLNIWQIPTHLDHLVFDLLSGKCSCHVGFLVSDVVSKTRLKCLIPLAWMVLWWSSFPNWSFIKNRILSDIAAFCEKWWPIKTRSKEKSWDLKWNKFKVKQNPIRIKNRNPKVIPSEFFHDNHLNKFGGWSLTEQLSSEHQMKYM